MPCNCGKSKKKVAMTSAEATEMMASAQPRYRVTSSDGTVEDKDTYVEAKTLAVQTGGTLTEVR